MYPQTSDVCGSNDLAHAPEHAAVKLLHFLVWGHTYNLEHDMESDTNQRHSGFGLFIY